MEDQITVNGRALSIRRLLGKGKGGYSYLAADERGEYVVKQIHHEPCEYYQFGDKLAAEQRDYERLLSAGIPMPRLLDVDTENERILKEYIPGPTAAELIAENRLPGFCLRQLKAMCARLYPVHLNIDYYPTNFVLSVSSYAFPKLSYIIKPRSCVPLCHLASSIGQVHEMAARRQSSSCV